MDKDTRYFIGRVVTDAAPVQPLLSPWRRAAVWCAISLPIVGLTVLAMSGSANAAWVYVDRRMLLQQMAALLTGVTAAAAALATTVPGYGRRIVLAPLVPLAVWLGDLGQSCVRDSVASGFSPWSLIAQWGCLPATIVVGAVPAAMIVILLRRGAPLTPRLTTVLAAVAASGLGNFGVRFVHAADASLVVLTWHFMAVMLLSLLSALLGRSVFNWRQLRGYRAHAAVRR